MAETIRATTGFLTDEHQDWRRFEAQWIDCLPEQFVFNIVVAVEPNRRES